MSYFVFVQIVFAVVFSQISYTEHYFEEDYPFLVKLEAKGKILDCAGTILTPCTVLTSAHCVEGVRSDHVTVSQISTAIIKYSVASTVIHPKYNSTVLANDIALLEIKKKFRQPWAPISLNSLVKEKLLPKCNFFHIIGWSGYIMKDPIKNMTELPEKPMKAPVKLISNENCVALIKNFGGVLQGEEKLCGVPYEEGEEEGCFTGPGGPLLCSLNSKESVTKIPKRVSQFKQYNLDKKGILEDPIDLLENFGKSDGKKFKRVVENDLKNLQIGVVSWGKSCSKVPSIYIKTDFYKDWIMETTKRMTEKCAPGYVPFNELSPLSSRGAKLPDSSFVIFSVSITILPLLIYDFISVVKT